MDPPGQPGPIIIPGYNDDAGTSTPEPNDGDNNGWTPAPPRQPTLPPGAECTAEIPCTDPRRTCCESQCADLQTNRAHCGGCAQSCAAWEDCVVGACVPYICDLVPEPPPVEPRDAGVGGSDAATPDAGDVPFNGCPAGELCHGGTACRCGTAMTCGERGRCEDGVCMCGEEEACASGESCCGDACKNLTNDVANCGACGSACQAPADACVDGKCVCASTGFAPCNGACRDFNSDPQHCGACGNVCGAGETCCAGACVNTQTDAKHCGGCGSPCDSARANQCTAGVCMCGEEPACTGSLISGRCNRGLISGWGCGFQL